MDKNKAWTKTYELVHILSWYSLHLMHIFVLTVIIDYVVSKILYKLINFH